MQLRDRFLIAQPVGCEPTLARAATQAGARVLIDATRPGWRDQLGAVDSDRAALRVRPDQAPEPGIQLAILAPWTLDTSDVATLSRAIDAWHTHGVPVAVEVRTRAEARRAKQAGAEALVARGAEGPGRVSDRSNLVLLPALAELELPLIAWGGAGPNATAALLVEADAVVLDAQLHLLPEAGVHEGWARALDAFDGTDVKALGTSLDEPFHVHARVADKHVHELWEAEQADTQGPKARRTWLTTHIEDGLAGWHQPPGQGFLPLGHDAAHARFFAELGSLEAVLAMLEQRIQRQLTSFPLVEDSPLAQAHGTRFPVVQGAMANVSEVPAFAKAVADAGGLPFLAFAALREHWAEEALTGTIEALDEDQAFGCGIIGLDVNAKKRDAHIRLIKKHKPPFALIAAGTAEQALDLEQAGISTYMHTPSQGIVTQALDMGISHVVVEGSECGGHIGKLPSLVLWDLAIQTAEGRDPIHLLLAGGVSDERSAAMAGVLAAATDNVRVGVLMGTAYLATREIVETGAIPAAYQRLVLASQDTAVTGETVGIRARSAPTPFTERVVDLERELVRQGKQIRERKEVLEHENLGATRIAARGLKRGDEGDYHEIPTDEQFQDGNYLMGQGAELLDHTYSIEELHLLVTEHAQARAEDAAERLASSQPTFTAPEARSQQPDDAVDHHAVAVVGLGCVLPDAPDVPTFWQNLLDGRVSITELPQGRWPVAPETHLGDGADETYTVLGGFIDPELVTFDSIQYRIPPTVADQMDESQQWTILAVDQALQDAGLTDQTDRDRWAVILGNAQGGEQRAWTDRRLALKELERELTTNGELDETARQHVLETIQRQREALPEITEDTMPGELSNVIAGRVCSVFDIGGPARTMDAACASSLAAIEEAVGLLREGTVDVAITGGVDRSMDPAAYAKFSAIGALSREGSFPFDERASGFVMGEGCGILVLKRLRDAIQDGDRIYAAIHGVGSSSDGKGKGITAPNPTGQARAVQSALDDAGWDPSTITLVEAHGTGTPVGDPAEVETLENILSGTQPGSVGLGSVKGNIGHLKAAAGAAGILKATLAIHHGLQPPTVIQDPTSKVDWTTSPLQVVREPTPWQDDHRRAGVSAFGFGGTNSHILLSAPPLAGAKAPEPRRDGPRLGLNVVSGESPKAVLAQLDQDPSTWTWDPEAPVRLAISEQADLDTARKVLTGELPPELARPRGVAFATGGGDGSLALVFPGQGSQYPRMALELAEHFPAAREILDRADQALTPLIGRALSELLELEGEDGQRALTPTEVCQPAVLTADIAVLAVLEELGVQPDVVAGHSLGEYAALVAADVLTFEDALHAVSARGREMADVEVDDPGGLVALRADRAQAEELLEGLDAWPANVNGPEQTVVAGTTPALETIQERAEQAGIQASQLPVSAAFHSPIVAPATEPLKRVLDRIPVDAPSIPVIANVTGQPYPDDPDAIRSLLADQVASSVEWVATMEAFEAMGVNLVIEAGPKRVLTNLSLANRPDTPAVPTLHPRTGEQAQFTQALLALAAHGRLPLREPTPLAPGPERSTRRQPTRSARAPDHATRPARQPDARQAPAQRTSSGSNGRAQAPSEIVVTGVSLGLPGQDDPFTPDGVQALLEGRNLIDRIPVEQRERMVAMGITRLVKDAPTGPELRTIEDPDDVVQLAGRLADPDLSSYAVEEDWMDGADATAKLAVAAALNALTDASIPLVRETRTTSTGAELEGGWVLPEPLQEGTGVILASAFPGYDSLLEAATGPGHNGAPAPRGADGRQAVVSYLADLLPRLEDKGDREEALRLLTELDLSAPSQPATNGSPASHASNAPRSRSDGSSTGEGFSRGFLFRALALGHAQLAQLIRARGPNLQVNAACASTTAALAMAQDWIEQGRCERVIVVGADVAGNEQLLPWVGAGFLSAGAATTSKEVTEAALPFDQRRHGMLIGSGAMALVLETEASAQARGKTPLARLVGTHLANSAYHGARLDADHVSEETGTFLQRACQRLGIDQEALARELVFVSHEPATPARGGSAEAEVRALRAGLGDHASDVLITNTKGLTGHAMGAGIEDAMAVELLRQRRAPPVANLTDPDPGFQDLSFSQGEATERRFSLRFAAGFGSQLALVLFERTSQTPGALDQARFDAWLEGACGTGARTERRDRVLRVVRAPTERPAGARTEDGGVQAQAAAPTQAAAADQQPANQASSADPPRSTDQVDVTQLLVELVSRKTGYPADVIDPSMDLEGDLGVDTVKQAEVLAEARKELDIPPIEGLSLADVPTIADAAALLARHTSSAGEQPPAAQTAEGGVQAQAVAPEQAAAASEQPANRASSEAPPSSHDELDVEGLLVELVSRKTGYPVDVIDPSMDLEGDLGVDTVKQAEVLAEARKELDIPPIEGLSLADVPTIQRAAALLKKHVGPPPESTAGEQPRTPEAPAEDTAAPASKLATTVLSTREAPPAPLLPEGTRVWTGGALPSSLTEAISARGGIIVDEEPELVVLPADGLTSDPSELVALLEALQNAPAEARVVVLAQAGSDAAGGLGPVAATLSEEGRNVRGLLVEGRLEAERIADELLRDTQETVLLSEPSRRVNALAPARKPDGHGLEQGAVVLAIGGLGAAVEPCLAALVDGREATLVVVGRSEASDPGLDPDDEDAIAALRTELLDQARQAGEVKPAEVEAQVQARIRQARRAQALARLQAVADVAYLRCDATDPDALSALVDEVREAHGEPSWVVHGAGIERSRAFDQKPTDEMSAVLSAKLAPVRLLTELLPEAHHVGFGSIAGVTGNPGQADYALANGALTSLLEGVDGTVIHWTAWDAAGGMADKDSVRTVLEQRGIAFIDPAEGARIFAERAGTPGAFCVSELTPEQPLASTNEGGRLVLQGDEAFLVDHQVNGRPLTPGVRQLEAMVDSGRAKGLAPEGLSAIRFEAPLWVTEPTQVDVVLDGEKVSTQREGRTHARAVLAPGDGVKPQPAPEPPRGEIGKERIYELLFHGPSFHVLEAADPTEDRVVARAHLDTGGGAPWALAVEAMMQAAGLGAAQPGQTVLPTGIEEIEIRGPIASPEAILVAERVATDALGSVWDATLHVDGEPAVIARAIRLQQAATLPELAGELTELPGQTGTRLSVHPIAPHEPRDPRAKRAADRAAGQRAAVDALRQVHGREVAVERDDDGRPHPVDAPGSLSITHGHGLAIAAVHPEATGLGVDLERVEARSNAWAEDHLTSDERGMVAHHGPDPDTVATLIWTLKEAASKALGTGLSIPSKELEVIELGDGTATIQTPEGELEARWLVSQGVAVSLVVSP